MPEVRASQRIWDAAVVGDVNSGGSKATGTLVSTGTDNDIYVVSNITGTDGNDIEIDIVADVAESIAVVDHVITVNINSGTTDANALIALIQGDGDANTLVTVSLTPDSSGDGLIEDGVSVILDGGVNSVASKAAQIGPMNTVAVFITVSDACTFQLQASASEALSSGRNAVSDDLPWFNYVRALALELDNDVADGFATVDFSAAGSAAIDVSPFAPTFLRLTRTDDNATDVTVTAFTVAVG